MSGPYTFKKEERISSKREIGFLFENGTSFIAYPLRIVYVEKETSEGSRFSVLVSVSKKKFKRAVKRNRVKRLIREAYRLNKSVLWDSIAEDKFVSCPFLNIAFIFVGNDMPDFEQVESAMKKALFSIQQKYPENRDSAL
ncbi:ribonuclease P protein component [Bacteroidales bacterium OttesenSCG-928-A17]|nr:ribonuclease P protein component [Bacteroidales bacterium OttesenSCG-928-A17]